MARIIDNELLSNLSKAQRLKLEREKKQDLETEYQKLIISQLNDKIDLFISNNQDKSINQTKLNIINHKYEIIEKIAEKIYNIKIKREFIDTSNLKQVSDYKLVNKYGKSYLTIATDVENNFINILENRFKDLELKQKLEKQVAKEKETNKYNQIYEYLSYIIKNANGSIHAKLASIGTSHIKEVVASDLNLEYTQDYLKTYNKVYKTLKDNYKGDLEYEKINKRKTDSKPLSIWWRLVIGRKVLKGLFK